jgi:hypothetical protein
MNCGGSVVLVEEAVRLIQSRYGRRRGHRCAVRMRRRPVDAGSYFSLCERDQSLVRGPEGPLTAASSAHLSFLIGRPFRAAVRCRLGRRKRWTCSWSVARAWMCTAIAWLRRSGCWGRAAADGSSKPDVRYHDRAAGGSLRLARRLRRHARRDGGNRGLLEARLPGVGGALRVLAFERAAPA